MKYVKQNLPQLCLTQPFSLTQNKDYLLHFPNFISSTKQMVKHIHLLNILYNTRFRTVVEIFKLQKKNGSKSSLVHPHKKTLTFSLQPNAVTNFRRKTKIRFSLSSSRKFLSFPRLDWYTHPVPRVTINHAYRIHMSNSRSFSQYAWDSIIY